MPEPPAPIVIDAGGLIAVQRRSARVRALVDQLTGRAGKFVVPAPALARVWRDGARQALLTRFLKLPAVRVELLDQALWQAVGELCGITNTTDVVDAAVVVCARAKGAQVVITSDPDDLRGLDPGLSYLHP